ncbi:hypothetical protein LCGC14_0693150 [marine sediment metagenome]|uniref:Uncharacterized protein n=1 Tax=marine sediment metagenome TaxID=412755 RepID=A0A0F9QPS8_9ZZZZ
MLSRIRRLSSAIRRAWAAGWAVMQWPLALFVPLSQLIAAFREEWDARA